MSSRSAILPGLSATNPVMATILTILMFSLAGIPPLAGFWAKWYVFLAAIDAKLYALAVIGVLASVVGAYYYLRIIKIMWFDEPVGGFQPMAGELRARARPSGAFVLFYVLDRRPIGAMARSRRQDVLLMMAFQLAPTAVARRLPARSARDGRLHQRARARAAPAQAIPASSGSSSKRQESGRGRRGRAWVTPHGNLAATLLLVDRGELKLAATLGFVAGWRCRDALDAVVPDGSVGIAPMAAAAGREPLRAEMAERCAGRRRQARRHPARNRRCSPAAARRWRSASASMSSRIPRTCPIRRPRSPRSAPRPTPRRCSWRCPTHGPTTPATGTRAAGWRASAALAVARRRPWLGCRGARRRQCRARHVRDHRRGLPLRDPRARRRT